MGLAGKEERGPYSSGHSLRHQSRAVKAVRECHSSDDTPTGLNKG
jgi:hypothetical protein